MYGVMKSEYLHTPDYGRHKFAGTSGVNFYNILIQLN